MKAVILSAEDDGANRKIIRDLFGKRGYRVIEATNGEQVVVLAKREKPDLILMDIQLPKLSGYDAARAIKANHQLRHIPIIAVTSYALSGDDRKAREAGCDDYVTKPFSPFLLLEKVETYLGGGVRSSGARTARRDVRAPSEEMETPRSGVNCVIHPQSS
jgi:two-component system cell cycle response regulator DivK